MSSADIILGTNYLSGSGTASRGLRFNSSNDNVYIGTGTFYSTAKLNVDGGIHLGNSTGTTNVEIKNQEYYFRRSNIYHNSGCRCIWYRTEGRYFEYRCWCR